MRNVRAVASVALLGAILGIAGCTVSTGGPSTAAPWSSPAGGQSGAALTKSQACTRVRTSISDQMKPLGAALGQYVGYAAASDSADKSDAADAVAQEVTDLATTITGDTSAASDDGLVKAAEAATASLKTLSTDPGFLADLTTIDDIPAALNKITVAIQPLADACQ
jgi:hypothetical protein